MLERIYPQCEDVTCPLHNSCNRVATRIDRSAYHTSSDPIDVLFISDHPSSKEMLNPLAFLGPEKKLIEEIVHNICPDNTTIAYSYLVRGWPCDLSKSRYYANKPDTVVKRLPEKELSWLKTLPLSTHPHKQQIIERCSRYLYNDINILRPKLIILFGNHVKEIILPNERKSLLMLQNSFREFQGATVRIMQHYTTVFKNPSCKKTWQKQLASCLTNKINETDNDLNSKIYVVKNLTEAIEYIDCLKNTANDISFDIETLNLNKRYGNKIATLQFSENNNTSTIIPYNHAESPFLPNEIDTLKKNLYELFRTPSKIKSWIGHNLKFECNVLSSIIGTPLASAPMFDTMAGAFLLDENREERVADFRYGILTLKQLALDYLNFDGYDKNTLIERKEGNLFHLPLQELADYGGMDTIVTRRLWLAELEAAKEQNFIAQLLNMMFYHYTYIILLFCDIEQNGFYVNKFNLRNLTKKDSLILSSIKDIIDSLKSIPEVQKSNDLLLAKKYPNMSIIGKKQWMFDFSKKDHPQTLFFKVCGLHPNKIGKSGLESVDDAWQEQNKNHPLVSKYIEWSKMRHLYDAFVTSLYDRVDPQKDAVDSNIDCCIRPNFNIIGTVTGRTSCKDPNLQNIPRGDTPAKKAIKDIFTALPNHYLVQLDYKANEIRWVGILAQDENLANALWQGKKLMDEYRINPSEKLLKMAETYGDIHKQTAAMVFGKPLEEVTKDERQISKTIIFAILYGSTIKAVADSMNKTTDEVQTWFNQFYNRFPKIADWKHRTENMAKHRGYVETANGRRRRFPIFSLFKDSNGYFSDSLVPPDLRGEIGSNLRQCVNSPIQGIASDFGMMGAALFSKYIRTENMPWKLCNAVHDSAVYQVPFNDLEKSLEQAEYWFTKGVTEFMGDVYDINFNLPLEVDFEIGLVWGSLLKWNFNKQELETIKLKLMEKK